MDADIDLTVPNTYELDVKKDGDIYKSHQVWKKTKTDLTIGNAVSTANEIYGELANVGEKYNTGLGNVNPISEEIFRIFVQYAISLLGRRDQTNTNVKDPDALIANVIETMTDKESAQNPAEQIDHILRIIGKWNKLDQAKKNIVTKNSVRESTQNAIKSLIETKIDLGQYSDLKLVEREILLVRGFLNVIVRVRDGQLNEIYDTSQLEIPFKQFVMDTSRRNCVPDRTLSQIQDETSAITYINKTGDNFEMSQVIYEDVAQYLSHDVKPDIVIFSYGTSGAGKTFTLFGSDTTEGTLKCLIGKIGYTVTKLEKVIIEDVNFSGGDQNMKVTSKRLALFENGVIPVDIKDRTFPLLQSSDVDIIKTEFNNQKPDVNTIMECINKLLKAMFLVRPTPNNNESSRTHTYMKFVLGREGATDGHQGIGTLTVIDMAGLESPTEVADIFVGKDNSGLIWNLYNSSSVQLPTTCKKVVQIIDDTLWGRNTNWNVTTFMKTANENLMDDITCHYIFNSIKYTPPLTTVKGINTGLFKSRYHVLATFVEGAYIRHSLALMQQFFLQRAGEYTKATGLNLMKNVEAGTRRIIIPDDGSATPSILSELIPKTTSDYQPRIYMLMHVRKGKDEDNKNSLDMMKNLSIVLGNKGQ